MAENSTNGNGTERTLGRILATLEEHGRRMDSADLSRTGLHAKVAEVLTDVVAIKAKTDTIDSRVDRLKADIDVIHPQIELVRDMKSKATAAVVVLAGLGAFFYWLANLIIPPILRLFG